jgi:cytochrome c553
MKVHLALLLAATLAAPAFAAVAAEEAHAPAKADLAKGEAIAKQVCASCHAVDGSRGAPPYHSRQGQHPAYLAKQLAEFKSGKRANPIMQGMAAALSEDDMRNVAAFYGTKSTKPGFAKNKELVTLGEKIYRGGIADKAVPACAGCHSPTGAGIPGQFPRIGGQHADYTLAQLNGFRAGSRNNNPTMTAVAAKLNDKEIQAVADYVAGLR